MPFWFNIFLFSFLSPLSSLYSFIFSLCHSLFLSSQSSLLKISLLFDQDLSPPHLVINLHSPHRWPPHPSPSTFRSLNWVVGVRFGMGFNVWVFGHWLIGWVGILGRWWCRDYGSGWLSFRLAMFVAVMGGSVYGCSGFWVIDWSVGLGFWAGGGVVVVVVVG